MISAKTAFTLILLAFTIGLASADESHVHEFEFNDLSALHIDSRVGTIIVERSQSGKVEVELLISDSKKRLWFSRTPDTSRMDLRSTYRNGGLTLRFDHKDVKSDWVVRVPDLEHINIELGVGTVDMHGIIAGISAEVGVGTIIIHTPADSAGVIDLSVSVGETIIIGGNNINNHRSLVSSKTSAQGQGNRTIRAKAGVGSIEVTLY